LPGADEHTGEQPLVEGALALAWQPLPKGQQLALAVAGASAGLRALLPLALRCFVQATLRSGAAPAPPTAAAGAGSLAFPPEVVVGRAPAMQRLYAQVAALTESVLPVLLLGE